MTQTTIDFENGSDGATLAIALTGATGNTLNGGAATFDSVAAAVGTLGAKWSTVRSPTAAAAATSRWNLTSNLTQGWSGVFLAPTDPAGVAATTDATFYSILTLRGSGVAMRLVWQETTATLALQNALSADQRTIAAGLTRTQKYLVDIRPVVDPTGVASRVRVEVRLPTSLTVIGSLDTNTGAAYNIGTVALTAFDAGVVSAKQDRDARWDYFRFEDARTTVWGVVPSATAPTANVGNDQDVEEGDTVNLTLAASTPGSGATISGYAYSITHSDAGVAGVTGTAQTLTFTAVKQGVYTVNATVTQTGGLTNTVTKSIYVRPKAGQAVGIRSVIPGLYSIGGGAADAKTALNDGLDATSMISPDNTNGDVIIETYNPMGLGPIQVRPRDRVNGGTLTSMTYTLKNGATVVDSWTPIPGSSYATQALDVDAAGLLLVPAITDRRALTLTHAPVV